jgi:hypothetical protein
VHEDLAMREIVLRKYDEPALPEMEHSLNHGNVLFAACAAREFAQRHDLRQGGQAREDALHVEQRVLFDDARARPRGEALAERGARAGALDAFSRFVFGGA